MDLTQLDGLLSETPFGSLTIEVHRAYGETQTIKLRRKATHKTSSIQESLNVIGGALVDRVTTGTSGHLLIEVTYKQGMLQYTNIEQPLES